MSTTPDDEHTMCAAGDGPIVLTNGESMCATAKVNLHGDEPETIEYWHRHCYDLAHVPPAREVRSSTLDDLRDWLTKWFADHLTIDTFKHLGDDELAAMLAKDIDDANWKVARLG